MKNKPKIIVILGSTASGKSDLAVRLAKEFHSEVISADSRQVYRGMDIGSGKITKKEMQGIPHHLLDVASPKKRFTVAQCKKLALKAIKKILDQKKIPIICGGTGFYIQAITENISIPEVKPDLKLRLRLEKKSTQDLFLELKRLDPRRAKNIDRFNKRRLIRALEIIYKTGKSITKPQKEPIFESLLIGIKKSPVKLKKLINKRLLKRLRQGMIEEVKNLKKSGLSWKKLEEFGLEYKFIALYLQKKISYQEMVESIQKESEHYAKRQITWFKRDNSIFWVDKYSQAEKIAKKYIQF